MFCELSGPTSDAREPCGLRGLFPLSALASLNHAPPPPQHHHHHTHTPPPPPHTHTHPPTPLALLCAAKHDLGTYLNLLNTNGV